MNSASDSSVSDADIEPLLERLAGGGRVFVAGAANEPEPLLAALERNSGRLGPVEWTQFPLPGLNQHDLSSLGSGSRQRTFFMTGNLKEGFAEGRVEFVPMQMRGVFDHLAAAKAFDVALLNLGERDDGLCAGWNLDYFDAVMGNSRFRAGLVNASVAGPRGAPAVRDDAVDLLIRHDSPLPEFPPARIDAAATAIAGHVAGLVPDGACVQTGIGAIPTAVLSALSGHRQLGLHSGIVDDGIMALVESGAMDGSRNPVDDHGLIAGMALGSAALYDWLGKSDAVRLCGANVTHDFSILRRIENFISINSAVEIDLFGQVNAEVAGGRQISGTGGAVDFMRAARASAGGRSIVAMTATARRGEVSRIVPALERGTPATAVRTDVDVVVTEHGVAELAGQSLDERAKRLIGVADPAFRDELESAWTELRSRM